MKIESNGAKEIEVSEQKRFENGGLQTMIHKKVISFILKLRYFMLLAEISILIGLNGVKRELDFKKAKA